MGGDKLIEGEGQNICTNASIHTYMHIYEYIKCKQLYVRK